jgi:peptide/nickel transport system substrate-binding protein
MENVMNYNDIKKISTSIICLLIVIGLSGCIDISDIENGKDIKDEDELIVGFFDNLSIYPYRLNVKNQLTIKPNIFNGLVEFDEKFKIIPALSESWNNPDNLTWRFYLRENVKFHNGYNFTAEDVKYSIDEIFVSFKSFIKEVIIVNNFTIEIKTFEPYPGFLSKLAQSFIIFSKKYNEEAETDWPIGTGAYKLLEYVEDNYTKLERFDDYWKEKSPIKTVIFRVIEYDQERINELISGNIDIAEYNVDESIDEILMEEGIKLVKYPPLSTYIIGFDLRENGSYGFPDMKNPTSDLRVRKAIYHAIDIEPLINGPFRGLAIPATQFITSYIFGYNPEIERLSYDLDLARDLLEEAGYGDGFDIEMDCITENYDYNLENVRLIAGQLSEIGINVSINCMSMEEFNKKVVMEKNTSLWLVGWGTISADGGVVYDYFLRTEGDNLTGFYNSGHYYNPEVERLGEEAFTEMNTEERLERLQEGFKIAIVDDVIIVPLFSQELFDFTGDYVDFEPRADLKLVVENIVIN